MTPINSKRLYKSFFIESGDRNGGSEKRKRKIQERKLNGQAKTKHMSNNSANEPFESSDEDVVSSENDEANDDSKLRRTKNVESTSSSSSDSELNNLSSN